LFSAKFATHPDLLACDWPVDQLKIARLVEFETDHLPGALPNHLNYIYNSRTTQKKDDK
jgi:hypothetical protein